MHRDIKPGNIMLMNDGGVKVMDFGVARLESSTLTVAGTVVGSVRYMAPEQMMGERVDGRADVFSLAAVAYELLTGRAPFPGKTITEVVSRVVHGAHVPPRQVDTRLPEALNARVRAAPSRRGPRTATRGPWTSRATLHEAVEPGARPRGRCTAAQTDAPTRLLGTPASAPARRRTRARPRRTARPRAAGRARAARRRTPARACCCWTATLRGRASTWTACPSGQAPVAGVELAFGRHVVRMEADGREPVSAEVELKPRAPAEGAGLHAADAALGTTASCGRGSSCPFGAGVTPPRRVSGSAAGLSRGRARARARGRARGRGLGRARRAT